MYSYLLVGTCTYWVPTVLVIPCAGSVLAEYRIPDRRCNKHHGEAHRFNDMVQGYMHTMNCEFDSSTRTKKKIKRYGPYMPFVSHKQTCNAKELPEELTPTSLAPSVTSSFSTHHPSSHGRRH